MKLIKEIVEMFNILPENEKTIFVQIFGDSIRNKLHKEKIIIYNLLLWRTSSNKVI